MASSATAIRIDELSDLLEHAQPSLIVDTRPFLSFRQSHVTGSINLYVPPLLLRRLRKNGCHTVERLTNCQDVKNKLSIRHDVPVIVYTDTQSTRTSPQILRAVVDTLLGDCHKLYVLEDPYEDFAAFYPHLVSKENSTKNDPDPGWKSTPVRSRSPRGSSYIGASKPAEIIPFLYLGNERDSADLTLLRKLGVSKVLNVSRNCVNHFPEYFEYLNVPVEDRVYADISQHFNKALQFIEHARGEGCSVLVHCRAGISRSATVIIAYLIQYYDYSMEDAFDFIKVKHPVVSPNFNFMGQLLQFQNLHRTKKSEGSTPELFDPQVEEEEEEEGEDSAPDPSNLDNGPFGETGSDGLEDQYPVLELQPVPIPSKQTTFSFGE
ncbi:hypothetical protein ACHWQZ_G018000 [Mnemiopsis leidyi]